MLEWEILEVTNQTFGYIWDVSHLESEIFSLVRSRLRRVSPLTRELGMDQKL